MTYQTERDAEQLATLMTKSLISFLATRVISRTPIAKPSFCSPAEWAHSSCGPARQSRTGRLTFTIWCGSTARIICGAAAHLRMQGDIDFDGQFVIADGPVNFPPLTPYEGFINKCNQQQIDYLIFGWDWRRDLCLTADFFLDVFMPLFKQRVAGLQPSPLQHLSLVGHSFGGMLIKLILNRTNNSSVRQLKSAVTWQVLSMATADSCRTISLAIRTSIRFMATVL